MTSLKQLCDGATFVTTAVAERARKSRLGWVGLGWFWVSVLLVLPNCSFQVSTGAGPNLQKGSPPRSSAIFCEIEKERKCVSQLSDAERAMAIRLRAAAVKLITGEDSFIGLDESPEALARCGGTEPEAVIYYGPFPKGYTSCVNCGEVVGTTTYPDANAACVAQCLDFFGSVAADGTIIPNNPPKPADQTYCQAHARVATNAPSDRCFANACMLEGAEDPNFADPRRIPEPVEWADFIGTTASGSDLTKTTPTNPTPNAGAASTQRMTMGDGYVEFSASTNTRTHVVGLATHPQGCTTCQDTDPTFADINYAIGLGSDGRMYVLQSGALIVGPGANGSFRNYAAGDRFRVSVRDKSDGTATVTYSRIVNGGEELIYTSPAVARYPFRVDAAFADLGATVNDVRIVRIQ